MVDFMIIYFSYKTQNKLVVKSKVKIFFITGTICDNNY